MQLTALAPPESSTTGSPVDSEGHVLSVGDRVTFIQHWHGELQDFQGAIQSLCDGHALVNYEIPEHLDDGIERLKVLQAPIGIFAREKIPMDTPNESVCPLQEERDRLLRSNLPPESAWLETCMVSTGFRQAYWRSREPCLNGKKRQYIGKENSPAHQAAIEAVANRKRLASIEKQLRLLAYEPS